MVSWAQLMNAQPSLWSGAADGWKTAANHAQACADDIHARGVKAVDSHWEDTVGALARSSLVDLANRFDSGYTEMLGGESILAGFGWSVGALQSEAHALVGTAQTLGVTIGPNGALSMGVQGNPVALTFIISEMHSILDRANAVDAKTAAAMSRIGDAASVLDPGKAVNGVQKQATHDEVDVIGASIPVGKPKDEVAAWWTSLSPQQQQQIQAAAPTTIAGMDGIPDSVKAGLHGSGPYDPVKAAAYAEGHYQDPHLFHNNCTNFASETLHNAGLPEKNNGNGVFDDKNWLATTHTGIQHIDEHTRTAAWTTSPGLHDFLVSNGSHEVPLDQVKPGDVLFVQQDSPPANSNDPADQQGMFHHTAIVTAVTPDGNILYTQQSGDDHDLSMSGRELSVAEEQGKQHYVAVRPSPNY